MVDGVPVLAVCTEGRDVADRFEVGDEFEMTLQRTALAARSTQFSLKKWAFRSDLSLLWILTVCGICRKDGYPSRRCPLLMHIKSGRPLAEI